MMCPECQSHRIRRLTRRGFFRARLAPLFGYYPWRCSSCGTEQLLRARGERKRKHDEGNPQGEAPGNSPDQLQR